ncbi:glycosyltransferase family 4 protein [Congregibacter brevis]|uniref:Glycosyltransferase family 4 protein n=1 Tax=Congregibacter brevis TaxID=3081201 RepID=A0ABZ0IHK5_9GAMM|nr:glycosyltransferase family 4 protein [Congregibacter sp. IMCC45268]
MASALLISEVFPPRNGGSGRWFFELYGRLENQNFLVAAGTATGDKEFDSAIDHQIRIRRLALSSEHWGLRSLTGLKFYYQSFQGIRRIVRDEGVSQIHCGRCLPEGVIGWLLNKSLKLPYLCFVHGEDIQAAMESRELSWMIRRVFSSAEVLIANSHNTARLLIAHWDVSVDKVQVLHPGMDAERFVPAERDRSFCAAMGWLERTVILTVGRLQRRKGHDVLIRALPLLLKEFPSLHYVIVGEGEERSELERLVTGLGLSDHVQFLGEVDDSTMIQCYQQCHLFALPNRTEGSDIEGFGMVLAEAQACGKAVLAGDSGGTRETMLVGETGIIVDCQTPEALADAIQHLLSDGDRLEEMGLRAREHVAITLDWRVHVEKARAIFNSIGDQ